MAGIRAMRKAERPGQILDAAFDEFVANGYAAARVENVAARIGATKGTIYFYFDGKEKLFEAALQAAAERSFGDMSQFALETTDDVIEDIRSFLREVYRFVVQASEFREAFRLLVAEGGRFPGIVDLYFGRFMGIVEARLRARLDHALRIGEIRGGLDHLPELILSPPLALQVMLLLFPGRLATDTEKLFNSHVEILLTGLLPRKARVVTSRRAGRASGPRRG